MTDASSIRLGLDAVRAACDALGRPQLATPTVLVAGTNGKGSTAAMLEAIARQAGLRTGLFQSPALGDEHEQIRLDGAAIEADAFTELGREVSLAASRAGEALTCFESATVSAFLAFARAGPELAIVEVGLGGARDATNVAEPVISVLTTVDLDHQNHLGSTLASIAREKAGVFRRRRPAVLGYLRGPALRAARQQAEAAGARVIAARSRIRALERAPDASVRLRTEKDSYRLELALEGEHQARNAAIAVITAEALAPRLPQLDRRSIEEGLGATFVPGRLEWLSRGEHRFLLDAAHNPAAATALADHLRTLGERPDLLFGAFADKDFRGMLEQLRPVVGRLLLTPVEHERGWTQAMVRDVASSLGGEPVASPAAGLAEARRSAPLLVAGSTKLVGDVRRRLLEPATSHAAGG